MDLALLFLVINLIHCYILLRRGSRGVLELVGMTAPQKGLI